MNLDLQPLFWSAMRAEAEAFVDTLGMPDGATYAASEDSQRAYCGDLTPGQQEAVYALGV